MKNVLQITRTFREAQDVLREMTCVDNCTVSRSRMQYDNGRELFYVVAVEQLGSRIQGLCFSRVIGSEHISKASDYALVQSRTL